MAITPKISIIIPVYKVEKYLPRCIDSLLNQSFQNLEIILVDDGSPDNSGKICDEYALKDARIKVIHKENGRAYDARNKGMDIATGDLIGFMDSDDFIHPKMYQSLYNLLLKHGADIAQCGFTKVQNGEINPPVKDNSPRVFSNEGALAQLYSDESVEFAVIWNKIYKKELVQNVRFKKAFIHDDEFFTYKLLYAASKVVVVESQFYYYYQSPNSMIRNTFSERKMEYAEAMEERLAFFKEKELTGLYTLAQKKYCLWILYFIYMYSKELHSYPELKKSLMQKFEVNSSEVMKVKEHPWLLKQSLKMACFFPFAFGFIIYHRMFRNSYRNPVSYLAKFLFLE
jgi:glycosyltransferase involved in cell wall biosynthesis